jgi:hypothetical protein
MQAIYRMRSDAADDAQTKSPRPMIEGFVSLAGMLRKARVT